MRFNSRHFFILSIYFTFVLNKIMAICSGNTYYDSSSYSCRPYFSENVTGSAPWGIWRSRSFSSLTPTLLAEARGNGRDVTIEGYISSDSISGAGAINSVHSLIGGTGTIMRWPTLPNEFTICSLTRYIDHYRARIFININDYFNWYHGHDTNVRGVARYGNNYITTGLNKGNLDYWLVMCGQNSQSNSDKIPYNIISDGTKEFIKRYLFLYTLKTITLK